MGGGEGIGELKEGRGKWKGGGERVMGKRGELENREVGRSAKRRWRGAEEVGAREEGRNENWEKGKRGRNRRGGLTEGE